MLVLTRKLNEQILIGEDIKVTLLRVRGNAVRIGIEAPRDVRIVRGELGPKSEPTPAECVDAMPLQIDLSGATTDQATAGNRIKQVSKPQIFVGTVRKSGKDPQLTRAPLAQFVSAG